MRFAFKVGPIAQLWLERPPDKREVTGSTPVRPTHIHKDALCSFFILIHLLIIFDGELAQLGERRPCKAEVTGSNPVFSTIESFPSKIF